jgi:hypothetical protein
VRLGHWGLTTKADHNDIRHSPIERVTREAQFPGTGWAILCRAALRSESKDQADPARTGRGHPLHASGGRSFADAAGPFDPVVVRVHGRILD